MTSAEAEAAAYADWRKMVGPKVAAPKVVQETVRNARSG
jgi:hypothetical protein